VHEDLARGGGGSGDGVSVAANREVLVEGVAGVPACAWCVNGPCGHDRESSARAPWLEGAVHTQDVLGGHAVALLVDVFGDKRFALRLQSEAYRMYKDC
jgi:hypothetical protein